jgi:hypothetical protein
MVFIVGVNFQRPKHALFWLHLYLSTKECMSILFLLDPSPFGRQLCRRERDATFGMVVGRYWLDL